MAYELYKEFINFFKKHGLYDENIFNYIQKNKITFDYYDEERNYKIGYYPTIRNDILTNVTIYVPFINNQKTLLINIYIYMHAIQLCSKLGQKIDNIDNNETLSMLYQKIYLQENPNQELEKYLSKQDEYTKENGMGKYKIALAVQNELLKYYNEENPTFRQMQKKAKRLIKKHKVKMT